MVKKISKAKLVSGAIVPVKVRPFVYAFEKLDEAEHFVRIMRSTRNRHDYELAWFRFSELIQDSWVKFFDEGKKISNKFQNWASKKDKLRARDELLNYMIISRHQSQHGKPSLKWNGPSFKVTMAVFVNIVVASTYAA